MNIFISKKRMIDTTKCANYKQCYNDHIWNFDTFHRFDIDVDRMNYMLCERCKDSIRKKVVPTFHFMSLKNIIQKAIAGEADWSNI